MRTRILPLALLLLTSCAALSCVAQSQESPTSSPQSAQPRSEASTIAFRRAQHLRHGINASEWFAQRASYSMDFLRTYTDANDIRLMKQMGFDHVRMSID